MGRKIKQFNIFDAETGKLELTKTTNMEKAVFGNGWNMVNRNAMLDAALMLKPTDLKVLLWLIGKCNFQDYITFGRMRAAKLLDMDSRTLAKGLNALQQCGLLDDIDIDGSRQWLLNPWAISCGKQLTLKRRTMWGYIKTYDKVADSPLPATGSIGNEIVEEAAK